MDIFNNSGRKRSAFTWDRGTQVPRAGMRMGGWRRSGSARMAAFSLIEVTLAVGIMGFAFVAILGMVPVGLKNYRETKNTAVSSQIAQQILSQVQVAPYSQLTQPGSNPATVQNGDVTSSSLRLAAPPETPASSTPYVRYFSEEGTEVLSTDASGIYQVNTRVLVAPPFVQTAATGGVGNGEVLGVAIQVAYNPGRATLVMDPHDASLWATGVGKNLQAPIYQVETNVACNY